MCEVLTDIAVVVAASIIVWWIFGKLIKNL